MNKPWDYLETHPRSIEQAMDNIENAFGVPSSKIHRWVIWNKNEELDINFDEALEELLRLELIESYD